MDQEQVCSQGQFRPFYQGLHRFVDFVAKHDNENYNNNNYWRHTVHMVDENGILNTCGAATRDATGREMLPEGGLTYSYSPVPVNFP